MKRTISPKTVAVDANLLARVQRAVLDWYAREQRDLPWRRTADPYAILVSEVMLQQTGVDRVLPKYKEFLSRFPTFEALASADVAGVIRAWSPLGYNRRAVNLHRLANEVVARGGRLPETLDGLLALPGIGPYTARAVACFALRQEVTVVDTNIRRVLARLLLGELLPVSPPPRVAVLAERALPAGRAYDWNQALMDLGATICTTERPSCRVCPAREECRARPALARTGGVAPERAVSESRAVYRVQPPFKHSTRYYRGRIVDALRALPPDGWLALDAMGVAVKPGYTPADASWLRALVDGLARDGLVLAREGSGGTHIGLP
ncbi:MAG: A/G-specific adenine glycosylase [Dehalococcoidia bacterium]|nr:A/G-specific adenine glycosylase [Dehalococcoidia bacterium]